MNNDHNKHPEEENDLTKDAFFGDIRNMEKNIYDDALRLVEQAVSLVNSNFFDDAIEILRQAIGLFQQINKEMEINALRNKIAEIYILKEEAAQKEGLPPEISEKEIEAEPSIKKDEQEIIKEEVKKEIPEQYKTYDPDKLIKDAKSFIQTNEFNKAIDKYDEVIRYFKELKNEPEIERVYGLIEECYVAKAEYLKKIKSEPTEKEIKIKEEKEEVPQELPSREQKVEIPLELPSREQKVEIPQELPSGEEKGEFESKRLEIETDKLKSVEEHYKKEFEEEAFRENITKMADEANKLIRNYELEIKKGFFELEPPYQKALKIYEDIRNQLLEKGWNSQADIYTNQINIISNKLTQDLKLREIEAHKKEKEKEYFEHLKTQKIEEPDVEKLKAVEKKFKKEFEEDDFKKWVNEMADEASKLIRNYELEIKKGYFELEPPYQKALEIYENIRNQFLERDWRNQADIYLNQIRIVQQKEAQDLKLRGIEAQKKNKEKAYQDSLRFKQIDTESEKLKAVEEKVAKDGEDKKFGDIIGKLIETADKLERDYETIKKKAIREKKLLETEAPFLKIIEIYEKIKNMLLEKGWNKEMEIHQKNISLYREKYERDKILRDIEAHKLHK